MARFTLRSLAVIGALLLGGCGLLPEQVDETAGWSAQRLYTEAKQFMTDGYYDQAIKLYEKLEARYPYGRFAQQAQIETAYAQYKSSEPALAIAAADRFIKLHPNHPNVDYVYYLKGLATFNEDLGLLAGLSNQDLSERDPKAAQESFDTFSQLVTRFPDSKYADDARMRMQYLVNALAQHEVHVARYYYRRGAYVAAINRSQAALKTYPQAPAIEEALVVLVKSYDALGMTDLRKDAERVLQKNFPNSVYMADGPKVDRPWWQLW
ncbi:MAG TPA: outer membrane protein assembly factor BamD [Aromatoleum sp.]|uniref:outer membrane protein assembly factor BamD n=1 Tax=Aromatoleum sp. TaxID=2307007 RepID=UPI002B49444B|nr:outer membrane protein assembly factor BamD [Aromatoleum sp.]HJV26980.1 outer membrane protein assembly factor BamD [Aromatoleum sp.]